MAILSSAFLKILQGCQEMIVQIVTILGEISKKEDVNEFITTVQIVQVTINALINDEEAKDFHFPHLQELQLHLKEMVTLLAEMNKSGKLARFLTNIRLRRKLENTNSQVFKNFLRFRDSIKMQTIISEDDSQQVTFIFGVLAIITVIAN